MVFKTYKMNDMKGKQGMVCMGLLLVLSSCHTGKRQGKKWLKWFKSWSSFEKGKAGFSYFPSEDLHLWYLKPIK